MIFIVSGQNYDFVRRARASINSSIPERNSIAACRKRVAYTRAHSRAREVLQRRYVQWFADELRFTGIETRAKTYTQAVPFATTPSATARATKSISIPPSA